MISPIKMDVNFDNKADNMRVKLLQEKIMDMDNKIKLYQDYKNFLHTQIVDIVGNQLLNQYIQNCEPEIGQIIVNYDFGFLYMYDGSNKLKFINGDE